MFARELAAQDCAAEPTPLTRWRLRLRLHQERRALTRALRLAVCPERCYAAGNWIVWITREGTVVVTNDVELDTLNRLVSLEQANEVLEPHGLCLWPTSDDGVTAVLLDTAERYLASASVGDDGNVRLLRPDRQALTLTYVCHPDAHGWPLVTCNTRTVAAAQLGEFWPPLPV
ncbi:hypothetical protein D9600_13090 [Deinococcus sp. DB0503]|nr:hypothetical protein [Deinococcus sp. DB0503]